MVPNLQKTFERPSAGASRQSVIRNTYWLLSLSMIPTVLGAWVGVQTALPLMSGGFGVLMFLLIAFGFIFAIEKTKNSAAGVLVLLGFTFFMGLMLAPLLMYTLHFRNGPALIMGACLGTGTVFATMATIATVSKRDFSGMGSWLFAGLMVLVVASLANIFLHLSALYLATLVLSTVIFTGLLLFDVQRIVRGGETNYITATLSIYLDLYNLFTTILQILGIGFGRRD